jgi:membrane protein
VLAAVPALEAYRNEIKGFVFDNLMPESGKTFAKYFDGFIANAGKLTGFGIVELIVTAMMLINTIFMPMNLIFHVEKLHLIYLRIGVYLGVLIAGPLVLAASFSLVTHFYDHDQDFGCRCSYWGAGECDTFGSSADSYSQLFNFLQGGS